MNTAIALFEVYKTLPKNIKKQFKKLVIHEDELSLMDEIEGSLNEVKLMKEGKIKTQTYAELKKSLF